MNENKVFSYYVMEYIQGERFDKYWEHCSARDFVDVPAEILDALNYLHSHGSYHMSPITKEDVGTQALT